MTMKGGQRLWQAAVVQLRTGQGANYEAQIYEVSLSTHVQALNCRGNLTRQQNKATKQANNTSQQHKERREATFRATRQGY